jgi:hypothetical protein
MRDKSFNYLVTLLLGVIFLGWGIVMITNNLYAIGIRLQYSSYSAIDGYLLIFVSMIFFIVTYFSLSPFNKIRIFFEGGSTKKKRKNKPNA